LLAGGARCYAAAWELRRRAYAAGWVRAERVPARVVSIGNLTAGGTGKTTLTLHLAERAAARGERSAVVCRNYRPGPRGGVGDETLLYRAALGEARVFSGGRKASLARAAAAAGYGLLLVDDGFSHWRLERDLDLVLLDARDLWGGEALLPAGRLREPRRALQRADVVIVTRLAPGEDPAPHFERVRPYAPAAVLAAGRHRVTGLRPLEGAGGAAPQRVHVVTATGNPDAVTASAKESGLEVVGASVYRDHHWFSAAEIGREAEYAAAARAAILITTKDAVRWRDAARRSALAAGDGDGRAAVMVLEVGWEWRVGGDQVEARVFGAAREEAS
jgi:tetraacyldisaccharide 4'-kinase